MKRFKFELQAVLEQRERIQDETQQSYAEAKTAHHQAREVLADLEMLKVDMLDNLHALRLTGGIDPQEQVAYQRYLREVMRDIVTQEGILVEMANNVEKCRLVMIEATQNKEAVASLRDEALSSYNAEVERAAQNEVDELATVRHSYRAGQAKVA